MGGAAQVYLRIEYCADVARAWIGNELIADDFWFGRVWEIGMRRFAQQLTNTGLRLQFLPLRSDSPIYIPAERTPTFGSDAQALTVGSITAMPEFEIQVSLDVK